MDKDKKYALLDTDFLYKSHLAKTKENHTLADLVMGFEEYKFFCQELCCKGWITPPNTT